MPSDHKEATTPEEAKRETAEAARRPKVEEAGKRSMQGPEKIGSNRPRNHEFHGKTYHFENVTPQQRWRLEKKYPEGVAYDEQGFPDFSPYATENVKISHMTGEPSDFAQANEKAGIEKKPDGFTWHHHEDCETMQLVPTDLHRNVPHTGGRAVLHAKEDV